MDLSGMYLAWLLHGIGVLLGALGLLLLTASMLTSQALAYERVLGFTGGVLVTAGVAGPGPSLAALFGALLLLRSPLGPCRILSTEDCPGLRGHREISYRIGLTLVAASFWGTDTPNWAFWVLAGGAFCAALLPWPRSRITWSSGAGVYCMALLLMALSALLLIPAALTRL